MRLKRLEIYGFKSFADRTVVVFDNGITGIVGPNGSGKSNLSDAVRWVLGEQSAKALRGGRMEDVIFNGTQKRKRLGYCEVSLVFDNEDHALAVDFTEVMITRRVYRSGEGEYYINKAACRLRDIIDRFQIPPDLRRARNAFAQPADQLPGEHDQHQHGERAEKVPCFHGKRRRGYAA